jgi:alpha-L-fucosidase 2
VITGICCRGGHRASVRWRGGRLDQATIVAGASGSLTVDLPDGMYSVQAASGQALPAEPTEAAALGRMRLSWPASSGETFTIIGSQS